MSPRHVRLFLAAFLLSVLVRAPQLGRPLSKNHEFATGSALVVMDVWWERGFAVCQGSPAVTYPGGCDGAATGLTYAFMQRDGVRYYISHLPLAYWVPYAVFRALHLRPSPVPLRSFNLLLHGLTAFLLYRFLRTVAKATHHPYQERLPLIASVLYLFMPAPLWYHGNIYMSDMAVQLPWAWSLAAGARALLAGPVSLRRSGWFLLAVFVTALTEWMGVFIALVFAAYAWMQACRTGDRAWRKVGLALVVALAAALGAALILYASIAGWRALLTYFTYRWEVRGTFTTADHASWTDLLGGLWNSVRGAWLPLLFVGISALFLPRDRRRIWSLGPTWSWSILPAALHLLVFLRYDGHEFAALKLGFFLCTALRSSYCAGKSARPCSARPCCSPRWCLAWYTLVNRPGDGTSTGDAYAVHQRRGAYIAGIACPDELICVSGAEVGTQLIFYAHRNIEPIDAADVRAGRFPDVPCSIIWFDFADDGSCTVHRRPRHGR
ncbi:MAG: hypothetical protein QM724_02660 [Flavobacteriales bacterium]